MDTDQSSDGIKHLPFNAFPFKPGNRYTHEIYIALNQEYLSYLHTKCFLLRLSGDVTKELGNLRKGKTGNQRPRKTWPWKLGPSGDIPNKGTILNEMFLLQIEDEKTTKQILNARFVFQVHKMSMKQF